MTNLFEFVAPDGLFIPVPDHLRGTLYLHPGGTLLDSTQGGTLVSAVRFRVIPSARQGLAILIAAILFCIGCGGGSQMTSSSSGDPATPLPLNFSPEVDLDTGGVKSASVVLADFNGDGKLDIAVSNFTSNTISVFLNQGNGVFGSPVITPVTVPVGLGPIVEGDFNEDGKPDLIASTIAGAQVDIILLGKGDGTFTQSGSIPNSFGFLSGRVADVNGDHHLDLIGGGNSFMSVALGNGDGTFAAAKYLPDTGQFYPGIDLGDVNGDGKIDIIGANYYPGSLGNIVVFFGNGDGTFQAPISHGANADPESVSAADFNGDGKLDLLIGTSTNGLVFHGDGTGAFTLADVAYGPAPFIQGNGTTVRAADLNGDGKPDALVVDYDAGVLTLALNDGAGFPAAAQRYSFTLAPGLSDLAAGDLNGDGKPDVAVVNGQTNKLSLFLSK